MSAKDDLNEGGGVLPPPCKVESHSLTDLIPQMWVDVLVSFKERTGINLAYDILLEVAEELLERPSSDGRLTPVIQQSVTGHVWVQLCEMQKERISKQKGLMS